MASSQVAFLKDMHSSISMTAGGNSTDGNQKIIFVCNQEINFVSNDSEDTALFINFDAPVGYAGTITLLPGETVDNLKRTCKELYAQGNGKPVPFRALGV